MSLSAEVLDAMLEAGCTAEQIVAAVKADMASREQEITKKREKARLRKQKQRARESANDEECYTMSHDVTVTKRDSCDKEKEKEKRTKKEKEKETPPTKEKPPTGSKRKVSPPEIPDWLDAEAWEEYRTHRKQAGKKLTPLAEQKAIAKLERMKASGTDPTESIRQTLENGWNGLFELKDESYEKTQRGRGESGGKSKSDEADAAVERALQQLNGNQHPDSPTGQAELRHLPHLRQGPQGS